MPRAIRGESEQFPWRHDVSWLNIESLPPAGVLVECDASIKSIIVAIDNENHEYIVEDLDEQRVVIKENMVAQLKQLLDEVRARVCYSSKTRIADNQGFAALERDAAAAQRGCGRVRVGLARITGAFIVHYKRH